MKRPAKQLNQQMNLSLLQVSMTVVPDHKQNELALTTHWVLVVMDQFTRRIIGFGVHRGIVALCRMFHRAIRGYSLAKYLSSDHDPLYRDTTNGRLIFGSSR